MASRHKEPPPPAAGAPASPADPARDGMRPRLTRLAELARAAPGLSGSTRAMILDRVDDLLGSSGGTDSGASPITRNGPAHGATNRNESPGPRSNHERLERLERSLVVIRRTFDGILRLTRAASKAKATTEREGT